MPQNLENKGLEFFLPSRSMVLKVVTGKIFKTLELWRLLAACDSILERDKELGEGFAFAFAVGLRPLESPLIVGLSKNAGSLIDNLCVVILSQVKA